MLVADLSEFHPLLDGKAYAAGHAPDGSPFSAVILRATYSNTHVDDAYVSSLAQARGANLMVGHYGYMTATVDAGAQGTFFAQTVKANGGLVSGDSIWCDCEEGTGDQGPRVQAFLTAAHAVLNDSLCDEGFYSGLNFYTTHIGKRISVDGVMAHLWVAAYQSTEPNVGQDLWQYTDCATVFPGVSGNVDASIFLGDSAQYRALFTPPPSPAPAPNPAPAVTPTLARIATPTESAQIAASGALVFTFNGTQWYCPEQLAHISTPAEASQLSAQGYTIIVIGNGEFYNPSQRVK